MSRYIYVFFLGIFFFACKNDQPVVKASAAVEKTPPKEVLSTTEVNNPAPPKTVEKSDGKIDTITVSKVEEIVENAKSNTVMYLKKGKYELEANLVYKMTKDERVIIDKRAVETRSVGGQLFFSGLDNFQIIGKKGAQIISKNPQAVPFFILQATDWKVSNLTVKNEAGGIIDLCYISNSQNIEMDRCIFDGVGTYGVYLNNASNVKFKSCRISNCTSGAIRVNESQGIDFLNSTISGNTCSVPLVNLYGNGSEVTLNNVTISDNKKDPKSTFENSDRLFAVANNTIRLQNCVIQNNEGYKYLGVNMGNIAKSQIQGVTIP